MEVEYLIEKLGQYLGGIDIEKVRHSLRSKPVGAERILGIKIEESETTEAECLRIKGLIDLYKKEEMRLIALLRELKTMGIAPSDMEILKKKIRLVRKRIRIYRDIMKKCQASLP